MYKKTLINLTAITMAMSLAFAPAVTSFAAEGNGESNIVTEAVVTGESSNVKAEGEEIGEVITVGENENVVVGEGEVVTIKGNPVGDSEDTSAVEAGEKSYVFIEGESVSAEKIGIDAKDGSTVVVSGDHENYEKKDNVSGENIGIKAGEDTTILVNGDVSGKEAIVSDGTGLIFVDGDVHGTQAGFVVESAPGKTGGVVIVNGEIGADAPMSVSSKIILVNSGNEYTDYSSVGKNEDGSYDYDKIAQAICDSFPEFYAYKYNGISIRQDYSVKESGMDSSKFYEEYLTGKYNQKVNFIVKTDESSKDCYKIIGGYDEKMFNEYGLMTISAKSALTVAANEGYTITGGEYVKVTDNGDNTYTVKINGWHGGIEIRAVLKPVTTTVAVDNNNYYVSEAPAVENEVIDVPMIFASFTITGRSDLPEVLGASLEDGSTDTVVRPVVKVTAGSLSAIQYKRAFIDTVKDAPKDAVIRLETSASYCIDKMMMEALASRPDVSLQVVFPVNHENVEVTVPAGYDVMSLLDDNGYCGFLYLNSVFNTNAQ